MGYRTDIRVDLDDLAEGAYAILRNPLLVVGRDDFEAEDVIGPDGKVDREKGAAKQRELVVKCLKEWNVPDLRTDKPLPHPAEDPTALDSDRCPEVVLLKLGAEVNRVVVPFFAGKAKTGA